MDRKRVTTIDWSQEFDDSAKFMSAIQQSMAEAMQAITGNAVNSSTRCSLPWLSAPLSNELTRRWKTAITKLREIVEKTIQAC